MHDITRKLIAASKNEIVLMVLLFLLCCVVLIAPNAIRSHLNGGIPPGEESYKELMISHDLLSSAKYMLSGEKATTSYVNGNTPQPNIPLPFGPEHVILALFVQIFGDLKSLLILPFVCGIASFFIVCLILKENKTDYRLSALFLFVLFMSQIFIYTFSVFTRFTIIIPLLLAGVLLMMKHRYSSIALFAILPFFGIDVFIVSMLSLAVLFMFSENKPFLKAIIFPELMIGCIYFAYLSFSGKLLFSNDIIETNIFQENLSMFGAAIGFSLFILILGSVGIISTWKNKKKHYTIYLIMLILIIAALFLSPEIKIPLVFFISYFASVGFLALLHFGWSLKIVGKLTIAAIIFGIILSSVLYSATVVSMEPNKETVDALDWLSKNSKEGVTVLSDYQHGIYIEYFAKRNPVISYDFEHTQDGIERYNDTLTLLKTRDYKTATRIINKYKVDYIIIDNKMKPLTYSENNVKGLPFLLENIESFKNVYSRPGIDIWRVKRPK